MRAISDQTQKWQIRSILVQGGNRFKAPIERSFANFPNHPLEWSQFQTWLSDAVTKAESLDLFEKVFVKVDSLNPSDQYNLKNEYLDVVILIKEKNSIRAETGSQFCNGEAIFRSSCMYRNLFGLGEKFRGVVGLKSKNRKLCEIGVSVPRLRGPNATFDIVYKQYDGELIGNALNSYFRDFGFSIERIGRFKRHSLLSHAIWRETQNRSLMLPLPLRHELGHVAILSNAYSFLFDSRDNRTLPTSGSLFRLNTVLH
jgi:outer membrane protein assembly factor BamA